MKNKIIRLISISLILAMVFSVSAFADTKNGITTTVSVYSYSSTYEGIKTTVKTSNATAVYASGKVYDADGNREASIAGSTVYSNENIYYWKYPWTSISAGDYVIAYSSATINGVATAGPSVSALLA